MSDAWTVTVPWALGPTARADLYATAMFQRNQNAAKFIEIYEDRQLPVRIIDQGKRRRIEWSVDPNGLKPTQARELLQKFAIGLPLQKPVSFFHSFSFSPSRTSKGLELSRLSVGVLGFELQGWVFRFFWYLILILKSLALRRHIGVWLRWASSDEDWAAHFGTIARRSSMFVEL